MQNMRQLGRWRAKSEWAKNLGMRMRIPATVHKMRNSSKTVHPVWLKR